MIESGIPPHWKEQWNDLLKQLQDPIKLQFTVLGIAAAIGFFGVYQPMDGQIAQVRSELGAGKRRLDLIHEVESLRAKRDDLRGNFPQAPTENFWTERFLEGIRGAGVALAELESEPQKIQIGDFQVVYFNLDVSGEYAQVRGLIGWIEENEWYARITRMNFKKRLSRIEANLTIAVVVAREGLHGA